MSILKEKVFQALGEASLCWDERPYGIFDSTNANRIGNELLLAIKDELMRVIPKEKFYEERNIITLNSPRGAGKVTAKLEMQKYLASTPLALK